MWWFAALGFVVAFSVGLFAGARVLALLLLALAVAGCGVVTGKVDVLSLVGGQAAPVRAATVARHSTCGQPRTGAPDYGWPLKPFRVQHPVRGNFGDPRTISAGEFGIVSIKTPGAYSFHNGVDIAALAGTPVYPVVSGVAHRRFNDEVIVAAGDRTFQYWHITPVVRDGQLVVASRTILGRVQYPANHVHLTEIDGGRVTNPALHLRPYHDHTAPAVDAIELRDTAGHTLADGYGRGQDLDHRAGGGHAAAGRARSLGRISRRACARALETSGPGRQEQALASRGQLPA